MLTEKNKDIEKAEEKARMLYESRQAEISDQLTRLKSAEQRGIEKGMKEWLEKGATEYLIKVAEKMMIKGFSIDDIAEITDLTVERLNEIKNNIEISKITLA